MRKLLLFAILSFSLLTRVSAQSTIAKFKYEEAEEAYSNNDYKTTLSKLQEVEKMLGTVNATILYLRIQAQEKLVSPNPAANFKLLEELRQNTKLYLSKNDGIAGLEDKFRDVYKVSVSIEKYPKTLAEANTILKDQKDAEDAKIKNKQREEGMLKYVEAFAERFKYKRGLSVTEFGNYNTDARSLLNSRRKWDAAGKTSYFSNSKALGNPYPEGPYVIGTRGEIVNSYTLVIVSGKDEIQAENTFDALKKEILDNIDPKYVEVSDTAIRVKLANANVYFWVNKQYFNNWRSIHLYFY